MKEVMLNKSEQRRYNLLIRKGFSPTAARDAAKDRGIIRALKDFMILILL